MRGLGSVVDECFRSTAQEAVLAGPGELRARLSGLDFSVSPQAFFQTNVQQAERLHDAVAEVAGAVPGFGAVHAAWVW